jgi:hypothetical protein
MNKTHLPRRDPSPVECRIADALIAHSTENRAQDAALTVMLLRRELALSLALTVSEASTYERLSAEEQAALLYELQETREHWASFSATEAQADNCIGTILRRRLQEMVSHPSDQVS